MENLELTLKTLKSEKKNLYEKFQKSSAEVKILKSDKIDLHKDINRLNVVITTFRREAKESSAENVKETKKLEEAVKQLVSYRVLKSTEEKALKNKQWKLDTKLANNKPKPLLQMWLHFS